MFCIYCGQPLRAVNFALPAANPRIPLNRFRRNLPRKWSRSRKPVSPRLDQ